jgi:hypothetical protein
LDVKLQFFLQLFIHPATKKQSTQSQAKVFPQHSRHPQYPGNSIAKLAPVLGLDFELFPARGSERVEARSSAQFRDTPLGLDPTTVFQSMERGIEGTLVHLQDVL